MTTLPEESKYPLGAWEYHSSMKLIQNSDPKKSRFGSFTHVAENDNLGASDPEETYHNWVMAERANCRAALEGQGLRLPLRIQQIEQAL